jgi:hypothetical protein
MLIDPTDKPTGTPPGLCPVCTAAPKHHPLDLRGISWYCPHTQTWAVYLGKGRWGIKHGVPQELVNRSLDSVTHRALLELRQQLEDLEGQEGGENPIDGPPTP